MTTKLLNYDALYSTIKDNTLLKAKISGIYDNPPDNAASPYIQLGMINEVDDELINNTGSEINIDFHIWSNTKGKKETLEVRELLLNALPDWVIYDGTEIIRDSTDSNWWHGIFSIHYYIVRD